jgi:hypothetical protein
VHNFFSGTPPEIPSLRKTQLKPEAHKAEIVFCSCYEFGLRHPVWVAEMIVAACNSVKGDFI